MNMHNQEMTSINAQDGCNHDYESVWSWLRSIHQEFESFPQELEQPRKRRKTTNAKPDCDTQFHRIPTPSASSHPSEPHSMPRKRRRSTHSEEQGLVHSDDDAAMEDTPKASSRGVRLRRDAPSLDGESSTGYTSSAVSGTSSPTKQLRYAALSNTGFLDFKFDDCIDELPPSLQELHQELVTIGYGFALIPQTLKPELQNPRVIPGFAYYDPATHTPQWRDPSAKFIKKVVQSATKCELEHHSEASWNMEVHRSVLKFAFRKSSNDFQTDYKYCTTATIIAEYRPWGTSSKCIDFCTCIEPPRGSPVQESIDKAIKTRPSLSINHTDWGDLCKNPIALSIETKRQVSWEKALLQIGTWHAAQWRSLPEDVKKIEFLAGIIVQDHHWYFVASTLQDGKSRTYHRLQIGSTYNAFDLFKLLRSLQCLDKWVGEKYWPAFQHDILKIFDRQLEQ
ncbi:unnamed protein product [Fusarium langsethiae]|nr:unnamed protein product [Fusarium langsethiae]